MYLFETGGISSLETQGRLVGGGKVVTDEKKIAEVLFAKFFFRPLQCSLPPTNCPWVSEDEVYERAGISNLTLRYLKGPFQIF